MRNSNDNSNYALCSRVKTVIVSPAVHKLAPSLLQHLDSRGIEALTLNLKKDLNAFFNSQPMNFSAHRLNLFFGILYVFLYVYISRRGRSL